MESMSSFFSIRRDELDRLPKYLEASEQRYGILKQTCFYLVNEVIRYAFIVEMQSRDQEYSDLHTRMLAQNEAGNAAKDEIVKDVGRKALGNAFRSRVYIKRVGYTFNVVNSV